MTNKKLLFTQGKMQTMSGVCADISEMNELTMESNKVTKQLEKNCDKQSLKYLKQIQH